MNSCVTLTFISISSAVEVLTEHSVTGFLGSRMCKLCKPNDNIPWGWQFCKKRNGLGCTQCEKTFVDILMLNKHYKEAHTEGSIQANFQEEKQTNKLPPTNASKSTALAAPNAPIDPPVSSPPLAASSVTAPLATCAPVPPPVHSTPPCHQKTKTGHFPGQRQPKAKMSWLRLQFLQFIAVGETLQGSPSWFNSTFFNGVLLILPWYEVGWDK